MGDQAPYGRSERHTAAATSASPSIPKWHLTPRLPGAISGDATCTSRPPRRRAGSTRADTDDQRPGRGRAWVLGPDRARTRSRTAPRSSTAGTRPLDHHLLARPGAHAVGALAKRGDLPGQWRVDGRAELARSAPPGAPSGAARLPHAATTSARRAAMSRRTADARAIRPLTHQRGAARASPDHRRQPTSAVPWFRSALRGRLHPAPLDGQGRGFSRVARRARSARRRRAHPRRATSSSSSAWRSALAVAAAPLAPAPCRRLLVADLPAGRADHAPRAAACRAGERRLARARSPGCAPPGGPPHTPRIGCAGTS